MRHADLPLHGMVDLLRRNPIPPTGPVTGVFCGSLPAGLKSDSGEKPEGCFLTRRLRWRYAIEGGA